MEEQYEDVVVKKSQFCVPYHVINDPEMWSCDIELGKTISFPIW